MSRKSFRQLLQKYLRGECTAEEKSFVEHWYGLLEAETGELEKNMDTDELEERLWEQIQSKMAVEESTDDAQPLRKRLPFGWLGLAASLLLVATWWFVTSWNKKTPTDSVIASDWLQRTNTTTSPLLIRLEDGSKVKLSPKSTLRFPQHFEEHNRTVYLSGDAFFDIQKSPARPFYVHTDRVIAKVLGTSFWVRAFDKAEKVEVIVKTGKVSVYSVEEDKKTATSELSGTILTPNQQIVFDRKEENLEKSLVRIPAPIASPIESKSAGLSFHNAPVSQALEALTLAYGITIVYDKSTLKNCEISAEFIDETFYQQLDLICKAIDANYQIIDAQVVIQGKGCDTTP